MAQGISIPVVQSGLEASIQQGARNVGTININASVDPSAFKNLAQPLGRVSGLATEFEKSIAASNARVLAFGASVGIINGVQNAFSTLVQTGIEVQKTLADIGAISGKSGQELSKFGDSLFEIGKTTGQTFQTASQAALEFSRQGLTVEQTLKRTSDALTLTRFTTLSASEAVDVLTAAANSFSETGITTAQIINKLVAVDTKFAVSAEDLAKGLARAGSIAQEVGVNFDQLNAAVTVAQERTTRGGAVIGNALKTIFTRIRSDETVQALRNVGVESLDAQGQLKGAIPLLEELSKKMQGLSGGERIQILEAVASKYNINILSALLNDLGDANSKFGQAVQVSAGAGNQAYERQIELNKTLAAQINNATVSATQLFNKLSEIGVTENLNSLLSFVNDLLSGFNKLLDSGSVGGDIAKGLIKGISDVFFTVGLPILAAIFAKLTADIAKFGVESLKTILGINQQVRERQALEQAVVNTLIRDQEVMASILALSGNRAKQEEYLLGVYNRQLTALQQVQNIASSVTPALMAGGLSATSGQVKKRGAGGYLPSQEAADVRRGVGGASASSKVVSIPNFAFGGGKRGTMIANTSEYVVPNFANGGSAIFNQDMARAYGLPAGAKKISAAGGYVPNFNRYVYDADRIEPDKNSLLKAILASRAKKNLIVGPAGSGKSTYGASLGSFITNPNQLADATEVDILSGAARTKDGGMSKNFQQIADAVNLSGGKISYLYTGNMDILSRRRGRIDTGPQEGDLRSEKQIAGSMYAPLNQFDFISKVKSSAKNFEMIRGAGGYIPNFADQYTIRAGAMSAIGKSGIKFPEEWKSTGGSNTKKDQANAALAEVNAERLASGQKQLSFSDLYTSQPLASKKDVIKNANQYAEARGVAMLLPNIEEGIAANNIGKAGVVPSTKNRTIAPYVKFKAFGLTSASATKQKDVPKIQERISNAIANEAYDIVNQFDPIAGKQPFDEVGFKKFFLSKGGAAGAVGAAAGSTFEAAVDYAFNPSEAESGAKGGTTFDVNKISPTLRKVFGNVPDDIIRGDYKISSAQTQKFADQIILNGLYDLKDTAASGYIPNFAKGSPLEDAIQREMAAGLDPSQIRVTKDGKLKNSQNPNGFAVINTRDEPNGKIPNFASGGRPDGPADLRRAERRAAERQAEQDTEDIRLATLSAGGSLPTQAVSGSSVRYEAGASLSASFQDLDDKTKQASYGLDKLFYATGALMTINATLEQTFKNTNGGVKLFGDAVSMVSKAAQAAATGALLGGQVKEMTKGMVGAGGARGLIGAVGAASPQIAIATAIGGALIDSIESSWMSSIEGESAKAAGQKQAEVFTKTGDKQTIEDRGRVLRSRIFKQGGGDDQTNAEYDAISKKLKEINEEENKRKKTADEIAKKTQEEAQEINKRVALTTKLNEISLAFNEGENKAFIARAVAQGNALKNQNKLTELQKFASDESIRELEFQGRLRTSKSQGIQDLIKELSQKGALATVDEQALNVLLDKARASGDFLSIEKEVAALAIRASAGSQTAISNAKAKNTIERNNLTTQEEARKFLAEQAKYTDIQKAALQSVFNIQTKIAGMDRERINAIKQAAAEMKNLKADSEVSAIEADQSGLPQTRARKAALATAKFSQFETFERSKIPEKATADRNIILEKYRNTAETALSAITNLSVEDRNSIALKIAQAKSIEDVTEAYRAAQISATKTIEQQALLGMANNMVKQAEDDAADALDRRSTAEGYLIAQMENKITLQRIAAEQSAKEAESPFQTGMKAATDQLIVEADIFQNKLGGETVTLFRDGLRDAMGAAISQTGDLGAALQNVAMGFLKTMQNAFLQNAANNITIAMGAKFAKGGVVSGGSGYRDDVPAMLTGGEFVMRKSAVQKYGASNLERMNSGGMFVPGTRGGGAISGENDLRAFANQSTTSGATDVLKGSRSSAFINLEDESQKLSRYALLGDDTINQEVRGAKMQAFDILKNKSDFEKQQKEAEKQQKKALMRQMIGTVAGAALSYGAGKLNPQVGAGQGKSILDASGKPSLMMSPVYVKGAYGGMIRRYASGGPTDDIQAMLMSGEYVMNRGASRKYGKQFLDSMNQGRAPRFADGGETTPSAPTTTTESNVKGMGDVNININVTGQTSQTETQGNSSQGGIDYKKMSEKIKMVVMETLNEEKRLGGSLRTR